MRKLLAFLLVLAFAPAAYAQSFDVSFGTDPAVTTPEAYFTSGTSNVLAQTAAPDPSACDKGALVAGVPTFPEAPPPNGADAFLMEEIGESSHDYNGNYTVTFCCYVGYVSGGVFYYDPGQTFAYDDPRVGQPGFVNFMSIVYVDAMPSGVRIVHQFAGNQWGQCSMGMSWDESTLYVLKIAGDPPIDATLTTGFTFFVSYTSGGGQVWRTYTGKTNGNVGVNPFVPANQFGWEDGPVDYGIPAPIMTPLDPTLLGMPPAPPNPNPPVTPIDPTLLNYP